MAPTIVDVPDQRNVISFYGAENQLGIHMEECAELIQAISKMNRGSSAAALENLVEEIADVLIIIEQLKLIYDIPDQAVQAMIYKKVARQEARIHDVR